MSRDLPVTISYKNALPMNNYVHLLHVFVKLILLYDLRPCLRTLNVCIVHIFDCLDNHVDP